MPTFNGTILPVGGHQEPPAWARSGEIGEYSETHWPPYVARDGHGQIAGTRTDTQPVTENALPAAGALAPNFGADWYDRIHVIPGRLALGNVISNLTRQIEVWNAWGSARMLSSVAASGTTGGITLAGQPAPPLGFGPLQSRLYTLTVSTAGDPVIDAGYAFDFGAERPLLSVTGRRIVVWSFRPDWSAGVTERLTWLTDVLAATTEASSACGSGIMRGAEASTAAALKTIGHPIPAAGWADEAAALHGLIEHAVLREKLATEAEAAHGARAKAARARRAEQKKVEAQIAETEAELRRHGADLHAWHARLFLPAGSVAEAVKARLDELDGLARQSAALSDARLRQAHHRAVVDDLAAQTAQLAALLGEPAPPAAEDFSDRLRKRLSTSRERDQQYNALTRDRHRATHKLRQAEERARRALEAIDASDRAATAREAMESAAASYRAAVRPWARLRLAHALLQEALNRFRERAQAPMVTAASAYFALMTGGRYRRLVADEADGRPVLRAEREGGVRIGVEAMSEGTADQLYLALRLAALELRRASHPQMPLVLDDVLITSDDERAANILRALARFAEGGQVMLFTHHRHLIEVAHAVLGDQAIAIHSL